MGAETEEELLTASIEGLFRMLEMMDNEIKSPFDEMVQDALTSIVNCISGLANRKYNP